MKKVAITGALAVLLVVILGVIVIGCGRNQQSQHEYDSQYSSIYIQRDGGISENSTGVFDQSYYSLEEFTDYVEDIVTAYNTEAAGLAFSHAIDTEEVLPVAVSTIEEKDSNVLMRLEYADIEHYVAFNEKYQGYDKENYFETCPVGEQAAVLSDVTFVKAGTTEEVDQETALKVETKKNKTTYFVGLDFDAEIHTEGEILYVSDNVTVTDKSIAVVEAGEPAYIIFR